MHAANCICRLSRIVLLIATVTVVPVVARGETVKIPGGSAIDQVDFERHVQGLLGRMGCNAGACHGSFQGKGGLYLSLFGYSAEKDYLSFSRDGMGRRVSSVSPDESLMLLKATAQVPHGGGKRFEKGSWQYQIIRAWIAGGAKWQPGSGVVTRMEVTPAEHLFAKPGATQQLKVTAHYADGSHADVTPFCDFRVNDDYIAEVEPGGKLRGLRPGDTPVVISYRGNVLAARALVPVPVGAGFTYPKLPQVNFIDREVFAKLRKLNVVPADLAGDAEFLRRVTIDTIGCLPSPEEVRAFIDAKDPDKRANKIDELLANPLHAAMWATKFSDITGNNVDAMEQPRDLAFKRSKMWHDWFRKRIADNVPYDEIVHGVLCATSRDGLTPDDWVKETIALEEAAEKGFDSAYADRASLDLFWRRNNLTLEQMGEHTAAAFMGVRLECAQCHKHPFDRWTQADYRAYANVFGQVKFAASNEAKPLLDKINKERREAMQQKKGKQISLLREVYIDGTPGKGTRQLVNPDSNGTLKPKALGGPEIPIQSGDARETLFQWLDDPANPFFARSFVNRVWGHYFGIGIVEPVDNFSVANPPSNPELLDALARDFVARGYDIRNLERTILLSRTYQLSALPNATNQQDRTNFSHSYVRRMMAEVVVDVLNSALGVTENFKNDAPDGCHAIEVASNRVQNGQLGYIFRIFGRPPRTSTCDCERAAEPALPQTLFLMTDQQLMNKITTGRLRNLLAEKKSSDDANIEELFLATLARFPNDNEKRWAKEHLQKKSDRQAGYVDIVWALINTREFILNH